MLQCNIVSYWLGAYTEWSLLSCNLQLPSYLLHGQRAIHFFKGFIGPIWPVLQQIKWKCTHTRHTGISQSLAVCFYTIFLTWGQSLGPSGIVLHMRPANERLSHIVMSSLIGWAPTQNSPWALPLVPWKSWYQCLRQFWELSYTMNCSWTYHSLDQAWFSWHVTRIRTLQYSHIWSKIEGIMYKAWILKIPENCFEFLLLAIFQTETEA